MISRISHYDLISLPVKKGQIYYVTDYGFLYKDYTNNISNRSILPARIIDTESQRVNKIRPIQGVNYYVVESNNLWIFDTRWVLKEGNTEFNTYVYDSNTSVSPAVIDNEEIQNSQGDKIIDNNGLLGNGSVVVRDSNRIQRGNLSANNTSRQLQITSYLDEGILLRPYGLAQDSATRNSVGTLQLGVQLGKWGSDGFEQSTVDGIAKYNGKFNVSGDLTVTTSDSSFNADIFSVFESDSNESVRYVINCVKTEDSEYDNIKIRYNISITPITNTTANVEVLSYTVNNDDLVPEGNETLVFREGMKFDAVRQVKSNSVTYTLMGSAFKIKLEPPLDGDYTKKDSIIVTFSDNTYSDGLSTKATLYYEKSYNVMERILQLESLVQTQSEQISELLQQINTLQNS